MHTSNKTPKRNVQQERALLPASHNRYDAENVAARFNYRAATFLFIAATFFL